MNITIKILSPQNVNDFKKIRLSALLQAPEMFGSTYTTEVTHQDIYFKNCLLNSIAFAAYHDKDIIGIAVLVRESAIRIAHKAHLASVFIEPKFQQKGIAHILLNTVIKHARAQRIEQILLTVVQGKESPRASIPKQEKNYTGVIMRIINILSMLPQQNGDCPGLISRRPQQGLIRVRVPEGVP